MNAGSSASRSVAVRMPRGEPAERLRRFIFRHLSVVDRLLVPLVYPSAWLLKFVRRVGVHRLPGCRDALVSLGVFPIRNHYYEPQFDYRERTVPFSQERTLPGIDWNVAGQLRTLGALSFAHELAGIPEWKTGAMEFYMNNGAFESGDAEYLYQLIRAIRPRRIYEVGSGYSTLMAARAIRKNRSEDAAYACEHVCIEPYEMPWLEDTGVRVLRTRVQDIEPRFFQQLREKDVLFIDSSHVIRPQGDVLFEYLEILPVLSKGVIVHVHDIFSPRNYPQQWLEEEIRLWNEQYLLEAFLTGNGDWEIIGALNYLHHHHYEELRAVAPFLTRDREPGSFYLRKIS